jgi:DNA helicase-2/ATP-dependent DNA helicase PcrA
MDILNDLNEQQKDAVVNGDGSCLVLAGAGSGKTRVITYRTAYLLSQGINPENILIMTFTNKAAREMAERIQKLTGMDKYLPYAGTFHHIAYKILKKYAEVIGYKNNFSVLDQEDGLSLFKICIKENIPTSEDKKFPSPRVVREIWSYTRNSLLPLEEVLEIKGERWIPLQSDIERVIRGYENKKKESNSMDFDDLLTNFLQLLCYDDVRLKFAKQFQYILVDEYQDTNRLQAKIVKKLSSYHNNILAVGDDAQSIYSFRAADIQNILGFEKDFSGAKIFKLETNYRSSQEILSLANAVIDNNHRQYKKQFFILILNRNSKSLLIPKLKLNLFLIKLRLVWMLVNHQRKLPYCFVLQLIRNPWKWNWYATELNMIIVVGCDFLNAHILKMFCLI